MQVVLEYLSQERTNMKDDRKNKGEKLRIGETCENLFQRDVHLVIDKLQVYSLGFNFFCMFCDLWNLQK